MKRAAAVLSLVSVVLSGASLLAQDKREHYTKAQFDQVLKQVSNWGRWGNDDQRGTLNLLTPARRKAAAALVKEGFSVSMARDLVSTKAVDNQTPLQDTMTLMVDEKFNVDTYTTSFHGFGSSHLDALAHTYYEGKLYNGYPDSLITAAGATVLDTAVMKDGVFTRGVLVDIPLLRGVPFLEKTDVVTSKDMDAWEKKTGVHIGPGDAVAIRTGRWALRDTKGPWDIASAAAGLDPSVILWLKQRDPSMLISDGAHDAIPSAVEGIDFPIHILTIVGMGMPLADQCNLEDVAKQAQRLGRQTFLLTLAPARIKGGTGDLINPIAVF